MNTFGVPYRILCEDPAAANHVYPGNCRLMAIFCSSVGLTGLPTDPVPELPPLVIDAISPVSGPDNTPITITGTNFGTQIGECKIGGEFVIVQTWTDSIITALASQGPVPSGEALALSVARPGGEPVELADAFTFDVPLADPVTMGANPSDGPDGTQFTLVGANFGATQGVGTLTIGGIAATVQTWADDSITATVVQATSAIDTLLPVVVNRADGKSSDPATSNFIITSAATGDTLSAKARKAEAARLEAIRAEAEAEAKKAAKKGKARKSVLTDAVDTHSTEVTMPEFASGAGIMVRNGAGTKILVGPFELEAGRLYPLPVECRDGIEIVPSGMFDITLILAGPL